jgi:hypothetical protein
MLHERIAAVVERDRMYYPGLRRGVDERPRIFGVQRERLVGYDVLSMRQRRHDDGHVQIVGSRVMDDVDIRVRGQCFVAAVCLRHTERVRFRACRPFRARGHGNNVDEPEAPYRIDVMRAHEPRADEAHSNPPRRF